MLTFYTDAQIPRSIASQLALRGIKVVRCEDVGKKQADDIEHLEYAAEHGFVLITADSDFLRLDAEWLAAGKKHGGILFIPPELQGVIGVVVEEAVFLNQAMLIGAARPEDMINEVWRVRLTRK